MEIRNRAQPSPGSSSAPRTSGAWPSPPTWRGSRVNPARNTESDLRGYLTWCECRGLDPLAATRPHIEFYVRWLQEVRRYQPFTVSRRMSVVAGFYRTCVIDAVLEHFPAEYVRRPNVPAESPLLGLTHLQFDAMLTTAKQSPNRRDFALVTMLGPDHRPDPPDLQGQTHGPALRHPPAPPPR